MFYVQLLLSLILLKSLLCMCSNDLANGTYTRFSFVLVGFGKRFLEIIRRSCLVIWFLNEPIANSCLYDLSEVADIYFRACLFCYAV